MTFFIGRECELNALKMLPVHKPKLVVIRGRRRIGKSRLALEFAKDKIFLSFSGMFPTEKTTAQDQRDEFAGQFYSLFKIPPLTFKDWSDAFSNLTAHLNQKPTVILFDEISWMGSGDENFIGKFKNWWDGTIQNYPNLTIILCGSVSTWIEKNIINSSALFGRISLTLTLEELSISESYTFLQKLNFKGSIHDIFKILSVTGGIPWYLEHIVPGLFGDDNIKRLCFEKDGLLVKEFDLIFTDLFQKRGGIYKRIVMNLENGPKTLSELRQILKYEHGGTLTQYLKDLEIAGFIKCDNMWSFKNKKEGKQSLYRIKDNYVRFYLKYIEPNINKIQKNTFQNISITTLPAWNTIFGYQVENLLLNNRSILLKKLGIHLEDIVADNPYIQKQTKQKKGCQIDYLIHLRSNNLILCEFKFQTSKIQTSIIDEMKEKVKNISMPRGIGIASVLVHFGEVSNSVYESDYFYKIINFENFLND